jgi:ABC-type transporter Mla subunit MlaD
MSRTAADAMYEAQRLHQDSANKILDANTKAIREMGVSVGKLVTGIEAQSQSIDRLERAVSNLVTGIESQRKTMADMVAQQSEFLSLAKQQTAIIDRLTTVRAA